MLYILLLRESMGLLKVKVLNDSVYFKYKPNTAELNADQALMFFN